MTSDQLVRLAQMHGFSSIELFSDRVLVRRDLETDYKCTEFVLNLGDSVVYETWTQRNQRYDSGVLIHTDIRQVTIWTGDDTL